MWSQLSCKASLTRWTPYTVATQQKGMGPAGRPIYVPRIRAEEDSADACRILFVVVTVQRLIGSTARTVGRHPAPDAACHGPGT